jgi:hypothetical protein
MGNRPNGNMHRDAATSRQWLSLRATTGRTSNTNSFLRMDVGSNQIQFRFLSKMLQASDFQGFIWLSSDT